MTFLKQSKKSPLHPLSSSFSFAKMRFQSKEKLRRFFQKRVKDKQTRQLFNTLVTGDVAGRLLRTDFRKLGLGHLLAISGMHFALIAAVLKKLFNLVLSEKTSLILLLLFLSFYFLFLGSSPSILRAFIMIGLYILGILIRRQVKILNLLGASLLIELFIHPLSLTFVGLHLSFLATLGISLFYQFFHNHTKRFLPKRTCEDALLLAHFQKWGYIFTTYLRKALSLNMAVLILTLPVIFYHFSLFPLLSIPYNLFIPALFTPIVILLIFSFIPPVRLINEKYSSWFLNIISHPPEILNFHLHTPHFPLSLAIFLITSLIFCGILLNERALGDNNK